MAKVGVKELKNQATEILRAVREEGTEYIITYRGEPIAVLLPLTKAPGVETAQIGVPPKVDPGALWAEFEGLRQVLDAQWREGNQNPLVLRDEPLVDEEPFAPVAVAEWDALQ
jgi:prevent-host-death family protein